MKDVTTNAKLDGNISDCVWNKYVCPLFDKVRALLLFRFVITEPAKKANVRKQRMVPYTEVVHWTGSPKP